jgi:hypothetical protein
MWLNRDTDVAVRLFDFEPRQKPAARNAGRPAHRERPSLRGDFVAPPSSTLPPGENTPRQSKATGLIRGSKYSLASGVRRLPREIPGSSSPKGVSVVSPGVVFLTFEGA